LNMPGVASPGYDAAYRVSHPLGDSTPPPASRSVRRPPGSACGVRGPLQSFSLTREPWRLSTPATLMVLALRRPRCFRCPSSKCSVRVPCAWRQWTSSSSLRTSRRPSGSGTRGESVAHPPSAEASSGEPDALLGFVASSGFHAYPTWESCCHVSSSHELSSRRAPRSPQATCEVPSASGPSESRSVRMRMQQLSPLHRPS